MPLSIVFVVVVVVVVVVVGSSCGVEGKTGSHSHIISDTKCDKDKLREKEWKKFRKIIEIFNKTILNCNILMSMSMDSLGIWADSENTVTDMTYSVGWWELEQLRVRCKVKWQIYIS